MKHIAAQWESYRKMVIPPDAPSIQVKECRQAFYAGASILFTALIQNMDEDQEPTEADMQKMESIQSEIDEFGAELDRSVFGSVDH